MEQKGTTDPKPEHKLAYRPVMTAKVVVLLLVLVVIGIVLVIYREHNRHTSQNKTKDPYAFTYKNLQPFKVGVESGQGISFLKPNPFGLGALSPFKNNIVVLQHLIAVNKQPSVIGGEGVNIIDSGALPSDFLTNFNKAANNQSVVTNRNNADHSTYITYIEVQAQFLLNSKYHITLQKGSSFSNQSVNSNAWKFDYTASAASVTEKKTLPDMQGELLFIHSKSSSYYFNLYSAKQNWQPNQAIWNKITNSLKIDQ